MSAEDLTAEAIVGAAVDVARCNDALRAANREVDRLQIAVSAAERRRDGLVRRWRREQLDEQPAPAADATIPIAGGPAADAVTIHADQPEPDVRLIPVPVEPRHRT